MMEPMRVWIICLSTICLPHYHVAQESVATVAPTSGDQNPQAPTYVILAANVTLGVSHGDIHDGFAQAAFSSSWTAFTVTSCTADTDGVTFLWQNDTEYALRNYDDYIFLEAPSDLWIPDDYAADICFGLVDGNVEFTVQLQHSGRGMVWDSQWEGLMMEDLETPATDVYIMQDFCHDSPCVNSGVCAVTPGGSSYSCACAEGFLGDNCQWVDVCESSPCQNNGICIMDGTTGDVTCVCTATYCGDLCELALLSIGTPGLYSSEEDALLTSMSVDFLELDATVDSSENSTEFQWSYRNTTAAQATVIDPVYYGDGFSRTLRIPPAFLGSGIFEITVTLPSSGISASIYINVVASELVAIIDGGTSVNVGIGNMITLDGATRSYDPDSPGNLTGVVFSWSCVEGLNTTGLSPHDSFEPEHCPSLPFLYSISDEVVRFNSSHYGVGNFTVRLQLRKDDRTAVYDQVVEVLEGFVPDLKVKCILNCNLYVVPSQAMSLEIDCVQCYVLEGRTYTWSFFHDPYNNNSFTEVPLEDLPLSATPLESFVLVANALNGGQHYKVKLTFNCDSCTATSSIYEFYTNLPPEGGSCSVAPEMGIALTTYFVVTCMDWTSAQIPNRPYNQVPLTYRFRSWPESSSGGQILYYGSQGATTPLMLSEGAGEDYNLTMTVEISDSYGSTSTIQVYAEVWPLGTNGTSVTDTVTEASTSLGTITNAKEAAQVIQALASVINSDTEGSDEEFGDVRTAMVDQIATLSTSMSSVDDVTQLAQALVSTTDVATDLTSDAISSSASVLTSFASAATSVLATSPDDTQEVAQSVLSATLNVMDASLPTQTVATTIPLNADAILAEEADANNLSPLEQSYANSIVLQQEQVVRQSQEAFTESLAADIADVQSVISSLVLNTVATGQDAVSVRTTRGSMSVAQKRAGDFIGTATAVGGATVHLGDDFASANGTADVLALVGSSYDSNPLSWGEGSQDIGNGVTNLTFQDSSGNNVAIQGNITVQMSPGSVTSETVNVTSSRNNVTGMTYHKINVTSSFSTLILQITPPDPDVLYDVYFKALPCCPSETDYAYNSTATVAPGETAADIVIPNAYISGVGIHYIALKARLDEEAVRRKRRSVSSDVTDDDYSLGIAQTQCMAWDPDTENWVNSGTVIPESSSISSTTCQVEPTTTRTVFGCSFITPPNLIDFANVWANFANLADNAVVFSVIISLVGIYVILLILAGRKDRQDEATWVVETVEDSVPEDGEDYVYKYIITVHTGLARGAGTDSQVWFTLCGKHGDTGVRRLGGETLKAFPTASSRMFVLRLSHSLGPLRFLRIWHDNSGKKNKSWLLDNVTIEDVDSEISSVFLCKKWLALDRDEGLVDRLLPIAKKDDIMKFPQLFSANSRSQMTDNHLFVSVVFRPYRSRFTRAQRLTCGFSALFMSMIVSCMFYGTEDDVEQPMSITIGPFRFSLQELWVSLISIFIAVPPNVLIVQIFRKVRPSAAEIANLEQLDPNKKPKPKKHTCKCNKKIFISDGDSVSQTDSGVVVTSGISVMDSCVSMGSSASVDSSRRGHDQLTTREIHTIFVENKNSDTTNTNNNNMGTPKIKDKDDTLNKTTSGLIANTKFGDLVVTERSVTPTSVSDVWGTDDGKTIGVVDQNRPRDCECNQSVDKDSAEVKKRGCCNRDGRGWPRWTLPLAWIIATLAILAPAFFVILYSMQWGASVANAWLVSFVLASFESVFLCDPMKVALVALMAALLIYVRKNEMKTYEEDDEDEEAIKAALLSKETDDMEEQRKRLQMEKKATGTFKSFLALLVLLAAAVTITFSTHDSRSFAVHNTLQGLFVDDFVSISNKASFFKYMRTKFVPNYFVTEDYNGNTLYWRERQYLADRASYRIGPARLRQLRVKEDDCIVDQTDHFSLMTIRSCYSAYSAGRESNSAYGPQADNTTSSLDYLSWDAWDYTSSGSIRGMPVWGKLGYYEGGGYLAKMDINLNISLSIIDELEQYRWLDRQTRALFVEFSVYNPNVNLFGFVTLLLEFPHSAGVEHFHTIQIMKAFALDASTVLFYFCAIVLVVYLIAYIVINCRDMKKQKKAYFKNAANLLNWLVIVAIILMVVFFTIRQVLLNEVLAELAEDMNRYVQFRRVMDYDDMFKYSVAVLNLAIVLKGVLFMRLQERTAQLLATMRVALVPSFSFLIVYAGLSIAFGTLFYFWFMSDVYDFRSFLSTQHTLLNMALGAFDLEPMLESDRLATPFFFLAYTMLSSWVLLSILVAILMDSHYAVQTDVTLTSKDHMLLHAFIKKIVRTVGKGKDMTAM